MGARRVHVEEQVPEEALVEQLRRENMRTKKGHCLLPAPIEACFEIDMRLIVIEIEALRSKSERKKGIPQHI